MTGPVETDQPAQPEKHDPTAPRPEQDDEIRPVPADAPEDVDCEIDDEDE